MVNINNDNDDVQLDVTNEDLGVDELEIEELEEVGANKIKDLRKKLLTCEEEKRTIQDDAQRARADFLNAKRRLEEERAQDKVRFKKAAVEELLPLCDSFEMAMSNTEAWEKADKAWRSGVEGIYAQLSRLVESYGVSTINPLHEPFDPYRHEAIGTVAVTDKDMQDKVVTVMQRGYEIKTGDKVELIRAARVATGSYNE